MGMEPWPRETRRGWGPLLSPLEACLEHPGPWTRRHVAGTPHLSRALEVPAQAQLAGALLVPPARTSLP